MTAKGLVFGILIGSVVGAGAALLLAPQEGAATRRKITEVSGSAKDKMSDFASSVVGKVQQATEAVKQAI